MRRNADNSDTGDQLIATRERSAFERAPGPSTLKALDTSTFGPALRILPSPAREDVCELYDVLHTLDDLVDEHRPEAAARVTAVEEWCRRGAVASPETVILEGLAERRSFPREAMLDFCLAMRHDIECRAIETEQDLDLYGYRAGGTVGIMLATLLGTRATEARWRMTKLGMAAQRTNILRDVDEDRANGQVYLARETIERFGSPEPGRREALMRDQIARADALYEEGTPGIGLLAQGRRGIAACAALYREILRQIEREGYGEKPGRVVVPRWRQRLIVARCRLPGS